MDERCNNCPLICKSLSSEDMPVHYHFQNLTPVQVISLIESFFRRYTSWKHLQIDDLARSEGNQLAVSLLARQQSRRSLENVFIFIAQAQLTVADQKTTDVWFRYGVPSACRDKPELACELTTVVNEILEALSANEFLLSSARNPCQGRTIVTEHGA